MWGPLKGPKGVEKTPVDAVYRADSFCCRNLGYCGRPRWVQFGPFWDVKSGPFGVQNGYALTKKQAAARRFPSCSVLVK